MTPTFGRRAVASLVVSLTVTVIAHLATALAFFLVQGMQPAALLTAGEYFSFASTIAVVLLFVAGLLGLFRGPLVAAAAGLVVGVLVAAVGPLARFLFAGGTFSESTIGQSAEVVFQFGLIYWVAMVVASASAGVAVWVAILSYKTASQKSRVAIVRMPAVRDSDEAAAQWDEFVVALNDAGFVIEEASAAAGDKDAVFVGERAVAFADAVVLLGESASIEADTGLHAAISRRGRRVLALSAGRVSARDLIVAGDTVYVAPSSGTDAAGIRMLRSFVTERGLRLVCLPPLGLGHLAEQVTVLPDGTFFGAELTPAHRRLLGAYRVTSSPAQVLVLDANTVLVPEDASELAQELAKFGFGVVEVPLDAFEAEGHGANSLAILL